MLYNVSQLLREPVGSTRRYDIDDPVTLPYEGDPRTRLTGPVTLTRTPRGVLVQATLEGEFPAQCSRCLQPATLPMQLTVEEEYMPTVDPVTGGHVAVLPEEETPFLIDERHHLDMEEAVRQAAVVAEPMAPVCRPDCRGLCPECGADLNAGQCSCNTGPIDERWAKLREMTRGSRQ